MAFSLHYEHIPIDFVISGIKNSRVFQVILNSRYHGAWRELKLLIVYVIDEKRKLEKSFAPLIDAPLRGYLQSLRLEQADQVLFVADGAHWIWNRVGKLVEALSLDPQRVHEPIDFYHAVEHPGKVAALPKSWSTKQCRAWARKHRQGS